MAGEVHNSIKWFVNDPQQSAWISCWNTSPLFLLTEETISTQLPGFNYVENPPRTDEFEESGVGKQGPSLSVISFMVWVFCFGVVEEGIDQLFRAGAHGW